MQLGCNRRAAVSMFGRSNVAGAGRTQSREGDVGGIQFKAVQGTHSIRHRHQQISGEIDDLTTLSTLGMQVRAVIVSEVIGGGTVAQVHVLHHPELAERS